MYSDFDYCIRNRPSSFISLSQKFAGHPICFLKFIASQNFISKFLNFRKKIKCLKTIGQCRETSLQN